VFAYVLYATVAAWIGILVLHAFSRAKTKELKLWHTVWLLFLPTLITIFLLRAAVHEARHEALIDTPLMFQYEHILFSLEPLLLIPAAVLVWFAPDGGNGSPWRSLARVAVIVITFSTLWIQIIVTFLNLFGFKDS